MSTNKVLLCSPYVLGLSVLSNGHQVSEKLAGNLTALTAAIVEKTGMVKMLWTLSPSSLSLNSSSFVNLLHGRASVSICDAGVVEARVWLT